ncbi:myosin-11-like isoform X2 [Eriocheir sinensis]|uniref:myosin-11-like isoform X2 n=1 Tax=Eriocheir sinensis TaxID=95602 RepID=UPI0021C757B8|nr:myosin-11-like isoform X2 [Eriocheir sinensis]
MGCGVSTDGNPNQGVYPDDPYLAALEKKPIHNIHNNNNNYSNNNGIMSNREVDRSMLEEYLNIEREIAEEEANNPIQPLELKADQLARLEQEIDTMESTLSQLEEQTRKEKGDVDRLSTAEGEVKAALQELADDSLDEQLKKEMEEYVAALNKQEIAAQELEAHRKQQEQVSQEVAHLEERAKRLHDLYRKHDTLLEKLFGGEYGSVTENQLEAELDELEAHRGRIMEANFKWRQAQMMLEYACKQLAVAVQKWQDLPTIPQIELEIRYSVAAETRNNLVAAGQNIQGAQRYLDNVQFPYCDPDEVETLNKATEYVFTDMQSNDRHEHAQACYSTTHKRANALLQWFDTVINTTIMKDLAEINDKVKDKTLELRRERVRLIQEKVKRLWGTDIKLDQTLRTEDMDVEEMARIMLTEGQVVKVETGDVESERAGTPPLLSSDELAPMPSNTIIFGTMYDHYQEQLSALAKQHQEEMEQFMKDQQNKTQRMNETLQSKLMARRQRRARKNVEEKQRLALTSSDLGEALAEQ